MANSKFLNSALTSLHTLVLGSLSAEVERIRELHSSAKTTEEAIGNHILGYKTKGFITLKTSIVLTKHDDYDDTIVSINTEGDAVEVHDGAGNLTLVEIKDLSDNILIRIIAELEQLTNKKTIYIEEHVEYGKNI